MVGFLDDNSFPRFHFPKLGAMHAQTNVAQRRPPCLIIRGCIRERGIIPKGSSSNNKSFKPPKSVQQRAVCPWIKCSSCHEKKKTLHFARRLDRGIIRPRPVFVPSVVKQSALAISPKLSAERALRLDANTLSDTASPGEFVGTYRRGKNF